MVWVSTITQIKKRDGRIVPFDQDKIVQAIMRAVEAVQGSDDQLAGELAERVIKAVAAEARETIPTVESIQDMIEKVLIAQGHARTAKAFILYRAHRSRIREGKSELMETVADILQAEFPAAGAGLKAPKLHAIGATASREFYLNRVIREADATAHLEGDWHIHGLPHYASAPHSVVLPYRALLAAGFKAGHGHVRPPRHAHEAAIATTVLVQAAQADCHGGVALSAFDADWAAVLPADTDAPALEGALGALVSCLNALPAQAHGQLAAVSLHVGLATSELGRAVTRALLSAIADGLGRGEPPLRPHVVFRVQLGVNQSPADPNHDLLEQAIALATRWPGLTFIHDSPDAAYVGHEARLIGEGTGLIARLTLNLPRLALRARREDVPLTTLADELLTAAAEQLKHRASALSRRPAGDFPLLMGQGLHRGAEALEAADPIADAIRHGHLAVGLVGLAEALAVLSGTHHGASIGNQAEALQLLQLLEARCATLSEEHELQIVLQDGESDDVAARFARQDRRRFGMIRGVTETAAYTHGAAVPAEAPVALGDRLVAEAPFVRHLPGGVVFRWRTSEAPTPEALVEALNQAIALGHRAFAVDFPAGYCEACGHAAAPTGACPACEASVASQRALVRQRGYLAIQ